MKKVLSLILCLLFVFSVLPASAAANSTAVIYAQNGKSVNLRAQPSSNSASRGLYFNGTQVFITGAAVGDWTPVQIGMETGYISSGFLTFAQPSQVVWGQQQGIVNNGKSSVLNLRATPSDTGTILCEMRNGSEAVIMGETKSHWYFVCYNGICGYCVAKKMTRNEKVLRSAGTAVYDYYRGGEIKPVITPPPVITPSPVHPSTIAEMSFYQIIELYRSAAFGTTSPLINQSAASLGVCQYAITDINGDGNTELLIGAADGMLVALYTNAGGHSSEVLRSGERDRYYVSQYGRIVNEWSNSAFSSGTTCYGLSGSTLRFVESIDYDAEGPCGPDSPWYLLTSASDVHCNASNISEWDAAQYSAPHQTRMYINWNYLY